MRVAREVRGIINLAAADGGGANANARQAPPSPCAYPPYVKKIKSSHAAARSTSGPPAAATAAAVSGNTVVIGAEGRPATAAAVTVSAPCLAAWHRREGPGTVGAGAEGHRFGGAAMEGPAAFGEGAGAPGEGSLDVLAGGGMGSHRVIQAAVPLGTRKVPLQILVRFFDAMLLLFACRCSFLGRIDLFRASG